MVVVAVMGPTRSPGMTSRDWGGEVTCPAGGTVEQAVRRWIAAAVVRAIGSNERMGSGKAQFIGRKGMGLTESGDVADRADLHPEEIEISEREHHAAGGQASEVLSGGGFVGWMRAFHDFRGTLERDPSEQQGLRAAVVGFVQEQSAGGIRGECLTVRGKPAEVKQHRAEVVGDDHARHGHEGLAVGHYGERADPGGRKQLPQRVRNHERGFRGFRWSASARGPAGLPHRSVCRARPGHVVLRHDFLSLPDSRTPPPLSFGAGRQCPCQATECPAGPDGHCFHSQHD